MRRWGQITEMKEDKWYDEVAKKVYKPDIYLKAAKLLIKEGKVKKEDFPFDTDGYRAPQKEFIDNITFDGRKPNDYLKQFSIGLKGPEIIADGKVAQK